MDIRKEILRCRNDFVYFANNYLKIVTKASRLEPLRLNDAQEKIVAGFKTNNHQMLLKARQLGSTTGIAAYFFWDALFNQHMSIAVVAHTDEAVKRIFDIYRCYYDNLPKFLKLETVRSRENEIKFVTGSGIKVGSASTQSFRGGTYQRIHASEYAFWNNMEVAIASLFQTATDDALIILESTANGMNEAYDLWTKDNGFSKVFLSWRMDSGYRLDRPEFQDPSEEEIEYSYKNKLSSAEFNWMVKTLRTKCANNWNIFHQEFPSNPEEAFVTTGTRFFPMQWNVTGFKEGYQEFMPPQKFHTYIMGVDTASGSPNGDYSAFVVINITPTKPEIVASFYSRLPPSAYRREVLRIAQRFNALVTVETNSYGLTVVEYLQDKGYPFLYRTVSFDKVASRIMSKVGFFTSMKTRPVLINRLYEYVVNLKMKTPCLRFQVEANRLEYNSRGKVEAAPGQHDDMCIAVGLALMGLDQVDDVTEEMTLAHKPQSIPEILQWERATGKLWRNHDPNEFRHSELDQLLGTSVSDFL